MNGRAVKLGRTADPAVVELMPARVPENKVKAAYDRPGHMERRRELAHAWADLLLGDMQPASDLIGGSQR